MVLRFGLCFTQERHTIDNIVLDTDLEITTAPQQLEELSKKYPDFATARIDAFQQTNPHLFKSMESDRNINWC